MADDYSYELEPGRGRVRVTIRGILDDDILADAFRAIYTDPDYQPGMDELTDCRGVTEVRLTRAGVRRLLDVVRDLQTADAPYRVAIVAPDSAVFGLARMYELMQDNATEQVRVFRSMDEAEAHLAGAND